MPARRKSEAELLVETHLRELGLSDFVAEYPFHPGRKWRFDYAVPAQLLAIEIEGGIHPFRDWRGILVNAGGHTTGRGYQDDLEKYNSAVADGWYVFRFSVEDVRLGRDLPFLKRWLF